MSIVYTNNLDMHSGGVPLIVHLGQYDSDFSLVFNLYSSVGALTIESGTTAEIRGTKSDGFGYSADATIDIVNKKVTVAGSNQMTAAARQNIFELVLLKNNKVLSSANFILDIEHAALDADTIQDESVLKELNAIIEGAATATQAAEDAEDAADRAEEAADDLSGTVQQVATNTQDIANLKDDLTHVGVSESVKVALLSCFEHVAWIDEYGQTYYDALEAALYEGDYPRITATFNPGINIIYTDDSLDTLKQYLVVKYCATRDSADVVIASTDYTLSGVLNEGENTIRVSYNDLATTFIVEAVDFYNIWEWTLGNNVFKTNGGFMSEGGKLYLTLSTSQVAGRRAFYTERGKSYSEYINYQNQTQKLGMYPIPVPPNANKFAVSITPNTQYLNIQLYKYSNGSYSIVGQGSGWVQGSYERTFTAGDDQIIGISSKYDSAGTSYPTEPTAFTVTFSEV